MSTNMGGDVIIACQACDHLYRYEPLRPGKKASCTRCGTLLYRHMPDSLDRGIALYLTAFNFFILANIYPFLSLQFSGRIQENILLSGAYALYDAGMGEVGLLVFLTSFGFPLLAITGMLYLLIAVRTGHTPPGRSMIYRLVKAVTPWSLISVFMLGVLIAIVKLQDIATVIPGISLYAFAGLLISYAAARSCCDPEILWEKIDETSTAIPDTGRLLSCHSCGFLAAEKPARHVCPRCEAPMHYRLPNSICRTWALLLSAAIFFLPANIYPVMTVIRFGQGEPSTILGGIIYLIEGGMWGLAMIVFVASIVIPVAKLIILAFLLVSIQKESVWRPRDRTRLYRITEAVGAWSMVDVFLVAILAALVRLDAFSTIYPGPGVSCFAAVVVITMFAAHSLDPRLIWDNVDNKRVN